MRSSPTRHRTVGIGATGWMRPHGPLVDEPAERPTDPHQRPENARVDASGHRDQGDGLGSGHREVDERPALQALQQRLQYREPVFA